MSDLTVKVTEKVKFLESRFWWSHAESRFCSTRRAWQHVIEYRTFITDSVCLIKLCPIILFTNLSCPTRYGCWSPECISMRLPSYRAHFLLLSSLCMEAVHDYLSFRLEARPEHPSCLTVKQVIFIFMLCIATNWKRMERKWTLARITTIKKGMSLRCYPKTKYSCALKTLITFKVEQSNAA